MKSRNLYKIGIIIFFGVNLFLTFNKHSKSGYFNYHSEIWADNAGYYVYLPATFNFNFDSNNFPDSIDTKTGDGFTLDNKNKKVVTKYTYGVALMQMPFYLVANSLAEPLHFEKNGFSPIYHWCINVASVFYLVLGLFFLKKFLDPLFGKRTSLLSVLTIYLATNLFYFAINETGMSHVYSFSLFCFLLYFLQSTNYLEKQKTGSHLLFGCIVGLIVLIRPTNLLFLSVFFFLRVNGKSEILLRIKRVLYYKSFIPIFIGGLIIILPQFVYWDYTSGSLINYSYNNEGFNWLNPKLINLWFSPNNGLFVYSPIYFLIIGALFFMLKNKMKSGFFILILFLILSYTFSSWWAWDFGCSYGSRSFVEYLSLFSIPVAYAYSRIAKLNLNKRLIFYVIIIVLITLNLKMIYSYDGCFQGTSNWDWSAYIQLINSPTK